MKVLVHHTRLGPSSVFVKPSPGALPASAGVSGSDALMLPALGQVAARGHKLPWDSYCQVLVRTPPYAGRWTVEDVPDGLSARQALSYVRRAEVSRLLTPPGSLPPHSLVPAGTAT